MSTEHFREARPIEHKSYTVECPHCEKDSGYPMDVIALPRDFGPWYCRKCNGEFSGRCINGTLMVRAGSKQCRQDFLVVLQLIEADKDVFFVLETDAVKGIYQAPKQASVGFQYFYEEHTCPTNWTQNILAIYTRDKETGEIDTDPHGLFQYVGCLPFKEGVQQEYGIDLETAEGVEKLLLTVRNYQE